MAKIKLTSPDGKHTVELDDKSDAAEVTRRRFGLGWKPEKAAAKKAEGGK